MDTKLSRRAFLERAAYLSVGAAGALAFLNGCSKGGDGGEAAGGASACDDQAGVDAVAAGQRTQLQYVSQSTDPAKRCDGCALYTAPAAGSSCGGCSAVGGPINPGGSCVAFAPKPA
jgi:hypothetical protein